jgi:hypothetical protein
MIDIIPKPIKESPQWQVILFYISIVLFIISLGAFGVVSYLEKKSQDNLEEVNQKLSEEETVKITALENEIIPYKEKIDEFAPFLREHILSTKIFAFLEEKTHPGVFFSNTKISIQPEDITVELSGLTDSFLSLGQQLMILESESIIKEANLSKIALGKTGGIEFHLAILLKNELVRH